MIFGTHEPNTLAQFEQIRAQAVHAALMADGQLGYVMPIGGVAAYRNTVSVVGVGFDIACGNCAMRTNVHVSTVPATDLVRLADEIQRTVSFGVGRSNVADDAPVDHPLFDAPEWEALPQAANVHNLRGKARSQLGTVGSGNHYVDVFADEDGWLWVGVHFGSRGFGHTVASGFLALAQGKPWATRVPEQETLLALDTPLGDGYWALMTLAGRYAYAGREWVTGKVVELLGGGVTAVVHNHHNYAWKEQHFGEDLVVVRKGATPAFPDQQGFVGGSMGDDAVILEGTNHRLLPVPLTDEDLDAYFAHPLHECEARQQAALYSTVHGAGRVMSRTAARGKVKGWGRSAKVVSPGRVSWDMVHEWIGPRGVILRGGGLDESPHVYRRLPDVLAAQGDTITVLHRLTPLIVVMAGENEHDPYKD